MNSTHPFYPILIPNTPYVKFLFFLILFVGGPKSALRGDNIRNKKFSGRDCLKIFE